jgi:hypothetical protein
VPEVLAVEFMTPSGGGGSSLVVYSAEGLSFSPGTGYIPFGGGFYPTQSLTAAGAGVYLGSQPVTISNFCVSVQGVIGAGDTYTFTLYDGTNPVGTPSNISVAISSNTPLCDTTDSYTTSANSSMSVQVVVTGSNGSTSQVMIDALVGGPGGGGGGGTVTAVTGVPPIASTSGSTPAISLQNSAAANVTASLGTDTQIFTASGSAATNGDVIEGDSAGGIKDSGVLLSALAPLASPTFTGTTTTPALTLSSITGTTECLQVNSSGVVSGTGAGCGGTGLTISTPTPAGIVISNGSSTLVYSQTNATIDSTGDAFFGGTVTSGNGGPPYYDKFLGFNGSDPACGGSGTACITTLSGIPNQMLVEIDGGAAFPLIPPNTSVSNCQSAASPAVCGSATDGMVVVAASASTVVVDTSAVTANSEIFVQEDTTIGTALSVTCNTSNVTPTPYISARTATTSFTITVSGAVTTHPLCLTYHIVN